MKRLAALLTLFWLAPLLAQGVPNTGPGIPNTQGPGVPLGGAGNQNPNLVPNGNFAQNPVNGSQGVTQNGWQWSAAGTSSASYNGTNAVLLASDASGDVVNFFEPSTSPIPTTASQAYTLILTASGGTGLIARVGTTSQAFDIGQFNPGAGTNLKIHFTATSASSFLAFINITASTTITLSNVQVLKGTL